MWGRSAGQRLRGTARAASDLDASRGLDGLLRAARQGSGATQIRSHRRTALPNTGTRLTCRRMDRLEHGWKELSGELNPHFKLQDTAGGGRGT